MPGQLLPSFLTRKGRKAAGDKDKPVFAAARSYPARKICDVRNGPPPPRGSLSNDKLAYLDWRLNQIRTTRNVSEKTDYSWENGRNTIGRTSLDIVEVIRDSDVESSSSDGCSRRRGVLAYEAEKVTGTKALKEALLMDNAIASMPLLARDAGSDSEDSSSSSHQPHQLASETKDKATDLRPASMFHRASFQLRSKDQSQSTGYFAKSKSMKSLEAAGKPSSRRPLSRFFQL